MKEKNLSTESLLGKIDMSSVASEEFEWPKYKTDKERIKALSAKYSNTSCADAFAQEYGLTLREVLESKSFKKDFKVGDTVRLTSITGVHGTNVFFMLEGSGIIAEIDMQKEKRFVDNFGLTVKEFIDNLGSKEFRDSFMAQENYAIITETKPILKLSLNSGFIEKTKEEFFEQIKNPTRAYTAKIISKNFGGFIVDVVGVQAFLPGSLAAANKILNFDAYIGKTVMVMVEDFIPEIKTFIMSHKKYLEYALPNIIKQYDWSVAHEGVVTGTNRYGIFVEFYDTVTGLLHTIKMDEKTRKEFDARRFKPGDSITCYVHDIQNNRLILSCFAPGSEEDKIQLGNEYAGKVTGFSKIGMFVRLKTGEDGVVKNPKGKYQKGDPVTIKVTEITESNKMFFEDIQQ